MTWGAVSEEFTWAKHENHVVISFSIYPNEYSGALPFLLPCSPCFLIISHLPLFCIIEITGNFLTRFKIWKNLWALILDVKNDELNVGIGGVCFCHLWYVYHTSLAPVFNSSFFIYIYLFIYIFKESNAVCCIM